MSENATTKKKEKSPDGESMDPVQVVREGAVAASIWRRQSPSGFAYYDFSLSRSWKSMNSGKTGYSKNFFDNNEVEICNVVKKAAAWIAGKRQANGEQPLNDEVLAA